MLKSKICFTVFVVYEIIAIILLHDIYTCRGIFGPAFCADSGFKYFLFCAAIPLLALIIGLWIDQIFVARRRRHSFLHHAGVVMSDVASGVRDQVGHAFDSRDIDKYLAAAILFGLKKYSDAHPQIRRTVHDIMDRANGHTTSDSNYDYDDDEDEYETTTSQNSRNTTRGGTTRRGTSGTTTNSRRTTTIGTTAGARSRTATRQTTQNRKSR